MDIKLKKLIINLTFSEETIMFKSDLYINGKKVGYCENEGRGGCTFIHHYDNDGRKLIEECNEWFKTQPRKSYDIEDFDGTYQPTLDGYIDDIVSEESIKREMEKTMRKGLVVKDSEGSESLVSWKGTNIKKMLTSPLGKSTIKNTINSYKNRGYQILNTNLPEEVLN